MTKLTVDLCDGRCFSARAGDLLLDAALKNGIDLPHDCRSGICGSCRVDVEAGQVAGDAGDGSALACQARVMSDVRVKVTRRPEADIVAGKVVRVEDLSDDVVGVTVAPRERPWHLPGQYCQFMFHGFPPRAYSPTVPLAGAQDPDLIHLHVRRVPDGVVSLAFGKRIRPGHRVKIAGPFGSAVLAPERTGRIVAVGTGTGFAPVWSVVHAALAAMPDREVTMIAGARRADQAYMEPALRRLEAFPRVSVARVLSDPAPGLWRGSVSGTPLDVLPALRPDDTVFAAGAPAMVEAVRRVCIAAGARCLADSFGPASAGAATTSSIPAAPMPVPEVQPAIPSPPRRAPPRILARILERVRDRARGHLPTLVVLSGLDTVDHDSAMAIAREVSNEATCLLVDGTPRSRRGLIEVVRDGHALLPLIERPAGAPLHVLPFGMGAAHDVVEHPARLAHVIELLASSYQVIVLSAPPMTSCVTAQVLASVAEIVVLATPAKDDPRVRLAEAGLRAAGVAEVLLLHVAATGMPGPRHRPGGASPGAPGTASKAITLPR